MTVSENQLIFAAVCGTSGIVLAFLPFIATAVNFISNYDKGDDSSSAISFLLWGTAIQLFVAILFHNIMRVLDITVGKSGLIVFGPGGAFDLFWKAEIIYTTVMTETITTMIKMTRDVTILVNAFLPLIVVVGGAVWGYNLAARQKHSQGSNSDNNDVVNVGIKMFLGVLVTVIVYSAWSKFAAYTLNLPTVTEQHTQTMAHDAAIQYWRGAVGIKSGGKDASAISIK
jgi:hypothetical protein